MYSGAARAQTIRSPNATMISRSTTLSTLRRKAAVCRDCDLWKNATQTVFGEGNPRAEAVFVGEQPGEEEDRLGRPFVGPAGRLLDRALSDARLDRERIYLTNVVKHFKYEIRGTRKVNVRADSAERKACRQWLDGELASVAPVLIVCLGATAANAILGKSFRLLHERGKFLPVAKNVLAFATVHPSYLLRVRGPARAEGYATFVGELELVRKFLDRKR